MTLGARSEELARDPNSGVQETAHEFVHTWNLMAIRPVEYRDIDYRTQPPVSSLWFSEGLTMFYADLLLRRAGIPVHDSTRIAHLERLIGSYLNNPGTLASPPNPSAASLTMSSLVRWAITAPALTSRVS